MAKLRVKIELYLIEVFPKKKNEDKDESKDSPLFNRELFSKSKSEVLTEAQFNVELNNYFKDFSDKFNSKFESNDSTGKAFAVAQSDDYFINPKLAGKIFDIEGGNFNSKFRVKELTDVSNERFEGKESDVVVNDFAAFLCFPYFSDKALLVITRYSNSSIISLFNKTLAMHFEGYLSEKYNNYVLCDYNITTFRSILNKFIEKFEIKKVIFTEKGIEQGAPVFQNGTLGESLFQLRLEVTDDSNFFTRIIKPLLVGNIYDPLNSPNDKESLVVMEKLSQIGFTNDVEVQVQLKGDSSTLTVSYEEPVSLIPAIDIPESELVYLNNSNVPTFESIKKALKKFIKDYQEELQLVFDEDV